MLEIRQLSKRYGSLEALAQINLHFDQGIYGLLGPNGAGKTTLLKCLLSFFPEVRKMIYFNGQSLSQNEDILNNTGYLSQQFGLFPELSSFDALCLLAHYRGLRATDAREAAQRCLIQVNMEDRAQCKIKHLSGGMVRRLGIAQAMLTDPELLLLDEATAGLDPEERIRFKNIISEVGRGRITLLSTHIISDIETLCDQVVILDRARIRFIGSPEALCASASGKVYEIKDSERSKLCSAYEVISSKEREGICFFRIITSGPVDSPPQKPTLEEAYLCILKNI